MKKSYKIDLKRIKESRFTQCLILAFLIFQNIVLLSVNTIFIYTDGILFLFLSSIIAFYDSIVIVYCIRFEVKTENKQIV